MNIPNFERPHFIINNGGSATDTNDNSTILEIRQHLLNRNPSFEIVINNGSPLFVTSNQGDSALSYLMSAYAIKRPFKSDDFDYLKQNVRQIGCQIRCMPYSLVISYNIQYLTNIEQERLVEQRINEIIEQTGVNSKKNDFLKTKFIYDFILSNVEYDYTYVNRSAYNALFDKKAVCEGCAALLYRLLSKVSVPCRIITGKGLQEQHAWNIVKVGGRWYNLDVTWDLYCRWKDRTLVDYNWFLKGEQTFLEHLRDAVYSDDSFNNIHPMSGVDFYTI